MPASSRTDLGSRITERFIDDLNQESDETLALRRALVHAIILLQENKSEASATYSDFLLADFKPLTANLIENKHPYIQGLNVMRGRTHEGRLTLFLPVERVKAFLETS